MWLLSFLSPRVLIYAAITAAVGIGYWFVTDAAYDRGWAAALVAVEKQDAVAAGAAQKARDARQSCDADGGTWDVTNGRCNRSEK